MRRAAGSVEGRASAKPREAIIAMRHEQGGSSNEAFEGILLAGAAAIAAGAFVGSGVCADDRCSTSMKADIARSVGPQTTWDGPTTGPKAVKDKSIVYVSLTQNSSGNANSARGAEEAAKVLGWKFTLMDGKGTATGGADALAQAIALKPDAIILGSVSIENNKTLIQQANDAGIVVIGWHATDKPGPVADPRSSPMSAPTLTISPIRPANTPWSIRTARPAPR